MESLNIRVIIVLLLSVCLSVCRSQWLLQSNSAESVAMGLLRQFEGLQLPAASELEWLVPEHDAPQKVHTHEHAHTHTCTHTLVLLYM